MANVTSFYKPFTHLSHFCILHNRGAQQNDSTKLYLLTGHGGLLQNSPNSDQPSYFLPPRFTYDDIDTIIIIRQ